VLVFPRITKVGLVFGGQYGEGLLFRDGKPAGYFATWRVWGLQAGAQQYGYAMFFMSEGALGALTSTSGFEIGVGPSVVVVDQGMAKLLTTMNLDSDIYAFVFSQTCLMAGMGLRGNRSSPYRGRREPAALSQRAPTASSSRASEARRQRVPHARFEHSAGLVANEREIPACRAVCIMLATVRVVASGCRNVLPEVRVDPAPPCLLRLAKPSPERP